MTQILLATGNQGKIEELISLMKPFNLHILDPRLIRLELEVAETGSTYAENARLKAIAYAQASNCRSLADDSGLEVDPLEGAPGLHSARLAGPGGTDADRRAALLKLLTGFPRPWKARFRSTLALAEPDGSVMLVEGICEGEIIPHERGRNGFGYDPIFLVADTRKTMAELSMRKKNLLSHRARAMQAIASHLEALSSTN
jgi:XTP/dITP diphosphohydrolase